MASWRSKDGINVTVSPRLYGGDDPDDILPKGKGPLKRRAAQPSEGLLPRLVHCCCEVTPGCAQLS
jgi:hypothetical protein